MMLKIDPVAGECPGKPNFSEMIFGWGRRLSAAGARGGLAYRFALGFICTARGANLAALSAKDLLFLEPREPAGQAWSVMGKGEVPAAWWIHATVFADRGSSVFSFLAEGASWSEAAARTGAPTVRDADKGESPSTLAALEAALGKGNLVALAGIGALGLGSTADDAGLALLDACTGN